MVFIRRLFLAHVNCNNTTHLILQGIDTVWEKMVCTNYTDVHNHVRKGRHAGNNYLITWYSLSPYIRWRTSAWGPWFKPCKYSNCDLSLCKQSAEISDAVIFNGRRLPKTVSLKRPAGQIWIFAEDESPYTYDYDGGHWRLPFWRMSFNWTMTYDRNHTDIYLPSGEIRKKKIPDNRDFLQIAKRKTKDALIITSHCTTDSKRTEYINELQKYIDVDILGTCGRTWDCGTAWIHDNCFGILNTTYKFYLAFENALCREYRTEKFFENFNYDIVLVARGGISADDVIQPKDTYISASGFHNEADLGKYLKKISDNIDEYATILKRKSQYSFPGFQESYQNALCTLCEKMNHQEDNRQEIVDLVNHMYNSRPCIEPTDVTLVEKGLWDRLWGSKW